MAGRTVFWVILVFSTTAAATATATEAEGETSGATSVATVHWRAHVRTVEHFECGRPQRRSIAVRELLRGHFQTSETVVPHNTVLHRCDSGSGCCKERLMECAVAEISNVSLYFYVVDDINESNGYRVFTVTNHTRCSCQPVTNGIK